MIKIYLKQAWSLLKENPLISGLSIAGTALAITAVMLIVLVIQVRMAEYAPESNRGRMLHVIAMRATEISSENNNNGYMGKRVVRELFYNLKTPQAVSGYARSTVSVNVAGKRTFSKYSATYTDEQFWKIFDYTFLEGAPYTREESESGMSKAIISEKLARRLFGKTEGILGQQLLVNKKEYSISGVVEDASRTARFAYADLWMPYNSNENLETPANVCGGLPGGFNVVMLAGNTSDFPTIRAEVEKLTKQFNANNKEYKISFFAGPLSNFDLIITKYLGFLWEVPYMEWFLTQGGFILFLLLLPALNMIGITITSFRKRRAEIGVRKAFGATAGNIFSQVVNENLIITFIGGVFGLIFSVIMLWLTRDIFFPSGSEISLAMLVRPEMFLASLFFVFLLNLMCAGIPAWRAGKYNIVKSLNNQE